MSKRSGIAVWLSMGLLLAGGLTLRGQEAMPAEPGIGDAPAMVEAEPAIRRGAVSTAVQTTRESVAGVGEATVEVVESVKSGGGQVVEQGRHLWQDAVMPAFQRTAAAIPGLLKALLLLVAFWVIARLAGALVAKVLDRTRIDDKAAQEWGLDGVLNTPGGQKRSIARVVGGTVKWVILLFGFVAFFNALNLDMVAGPLQGVLDRIVGVVPNLLKASVILLVYWAVAAGVRLVLTKGLGAIGFDERMKKICPPRDAGGQATGASAMIARLAFYVILLFGIPPFLDSLGQQALVAPLQEMLAKVLSFIPNLVAAALIFFIGNLVATIVREVVSNFLAAARADALAEKAGLGRMLGEKKLSAIAGLVVYLFVIIPIVISAVDALQITAISEPMKAMLERILAAVPSILVAAVIMAIGYLVARFVRNLAESFLGGVGFDQLPGRLGLAFLKPGEGRPSLSSIGGTVVMIVILLLAAQQALASLGLAQLAAFADWVINYLPRLVVGLAILLAALSLGQFLGKLAGGAAQGSGYGGLLGGVAKYAIVFLGASMALNQLGVSEEIVTMTVSMVLGAAALALGLAFGLGGRDRAKDIVDRIGRKE